MFLKAIIIMFLVICIAYLFHLLRKIFPGTPQPDRMFRFVRKDQESRPFKFQADWRHYLLIFLGIALIWVLQSYSLNTIPSTTGLILVALVISRCTARMQIKYLDTLHLYTLVSNLRDPLKQGHSFFEALLVVNKTVPSGQIKGVVESVFERYANREPLDQCLRPLKQHNALTARLAEEVQSIGQSHSSALGLSLQLLSARIEKHLVKQREWKRVFFFRDAWVSRFQLFVGGAAMMSIISTTLHIRSTSRWMWIAFFLGMTLLTTFLWTPNRRLRVTALSVGFCLLLLALLRIDVLPGIKMGSKSLAAHAAPARLTRLPPNGPNEDSRKYISYRDTEFLETSNRDAASDCRITTSFADGWARVRHGSSMESPGYFFVPEGTVLTELTESGDYYTNGKWKKVRAEDGREGWVYGPLCLSSDRK